MEKKGSKYARLKELREMIKDNYKTLTIFDEDFAYETSLLENEAFKIMIELGYMKESKLISGVMHSTPTKHKIISL